MKKDGENVLNVDILFSIINVKIYLGVDNMLSPKLETERLILRRYEETDIDMQYEVLTDNRLAKYINFPNLTKEEELECIKDWIKNADDSKYEKWVITLKGDNTPIGNISVNRIEKKHNYCNVGYVILYAYWGKVMHQKH